MQKVMFTHKNGRAETMELRFAKILQGLKCGTYETRDMCAAEPALQPCPYAALGVTKLRALAKERGITGMSKAPVPEVIEALKKCEE